jgi:hypothetical protein
MKKFKRRGVSEFPADGVWADPLTAEITMKKGKQTNKYKEGDFVILFVAPPNEIKLTFMRKDHFNENFEDTSHKTQSVVPDIVDSPDDSDGSIFEELISESR